MLPYAPTIPGRAAMARSAAFTLLELMIVVTILAIIMAIAIPSVQNAKKNAAGAAAIGRLKTTLTVSEQYFLRFGRYASTVDNFVSSSMMPDYNTSSNSGYSYTYRSGTSTWSMNADPKIPGTSGDNYFFIDQTGVIRFSSTGPATSTSAPVD